MREIKFRTWTGKKMHYGNSSIADKTDWPLMQFTGLKDREGKEIWEGDILKYEQRFGYQTIFSEVIWSERWCGFRTKFPDGSFNGANYPIGMEDETDKWGEVLGNIYENGDLLK